jgi:carbon-monoxide dehydrogenase medium subunit
MIPSAFEYHAPTSIEQALELLAKHSDDAKLLAGGHSLLPMMKLRFAEPEHLIDINGLDELRGICMDGDTIRIGAMTTEAALLESDLLQTHCPLLPLAVKNISDPQVRNRGTIGGDISHGDPANDHPALMLACDATFTLRSASGERKVAAADFFLGTYWTALEAEEMMTEIAIPAFGSGVGSAYAKLKRKQGDWATAAAAVVLRMEGGSCSMARIGLTNVGPMALAATDAAAALVGTAVDEAAIEAAATQAMAICDPAEDLRGDVEYKTYMAGEMTRRAIREALANAEAN